MLAAALVALLALLLYAYNRRAFRYWKDRGVQHDEPLFILGNILPVYLWQKSVSQIAVDAYWKYPEEKVVGLYRTWRPELVIRDPDIVKRILLTDFNHFYPRGLIKSKHYVEPVLRNLFFADGDLWRLLRQRMTPAFSSGKLRAMFPLVVERAEKLQARVLAAAAGGRTLDARELMARYTTDFIGACGFGLDADTLSDEDSAFRKLGVRMFKPTFKETITVILKDILPETFSHLKSHAYIEKELTALVKEILKQRNHKPSGRNDFIDLLLESQAKGTIVGESIERITPDGKPERTTLEMDDTLIMAQVFVFFAAGFETSSSATSFTLHQLSYNPHVQKKVQEEIDRVLKKHDNKLSYDAIKEMTYLEWTFKEGMRIFPSLGYLKRRCARKCTVPELNLTIDEGVVVTIPLQALHNDPKYFDSPDEFRPERFGPDQLAADTKYVYLPFGEGPRACIGARLGLMQSLAGLAAVLSRFSVRPAPATRRHPRVDPSANIVQSIEHGLPLQFIERDIL